MLLSLRGGGSLGIGIKGVTRSCGDLGVLKGFKTGDRSPVYV